MHSGKFLNECDSTLKLWFLNRFRRPVPIDACAYIVICFLC